MKKSPDLLCRHRSLLVVIDLQEKLLPVIPDGESIVRKAGWLLKAASLFGIPALLTEQYPQGLGQTVKDLPIEESDAIKVLEKTTFSCREQFEALERLREQGRDQAVICGVEAHICVLQSCLDLKSLGFEVFLVEDATGSRCQRNREAGIQRQFVHLTIT